MISKYKLFDYSRFSWFWIPQHYEAVSFLGGHVSSLPYQSIINCQILYAVEYWNVFWLVDSYFRWLIYTGHMHILCAFWYIGSRKHTPFYIGFVSVAMRRNAHIFGLRNSQLVEWRISKLLLPASFCFLCKIADIPKAVADSRNCILSIRRPIQAGALQESWQSDWRLWRYFFRLLFFGCRAIRWRACW